MIRDFNVDKKTIIIFFIIIFFGINYDDSLQHTNSGLFKPVPETTQKIFPIRENLGASTAVVEPMAKAASPPTLETNNAKHPHHHRPHHRHQYNHHHQGTFALSMAGLPLHSVKMFPM